MNKINVREKYVDPEKAKWLAVSIANIEQLNNFSDSKMNEVNVISFLYYFGLYDKYFIIPWPDFLS